MLANPQWSSDILLGLCAKTGKSDGVRGWNSGLAHGVEDFGEVIDQRPEEDAECLLFGLDKRSGVYTRTSNDERVKQRVEHKSKAEGSEVGDRKSGQGSDGVQKVEQNRLSSEYREVE